MAVKYSTGAITKLLGKNGVDTSADGLRGIFTNGVMKFYTGAQPASADDAVTGTLLGDVTVNGGAFTEGTATNGLNFGAPAGRTVSKATGEVWKFTVVAAGTIGWFRFQANPVDNDASSTSLSRIDGSVGITSGDLRLTSVTSASGTVITIDTFVITAA
jgi:hypothetical protein